MLDDGAGAHPEQDHRPGSGLMRVDADQDAVRGLCQHLFAPRFAPVARIGGDSERFRSQKLPPDTANEAEAVAAGTASAGSIADRACRASFGRWRRRGPDRRGSQHTPSLALPGFA